MSVIPLAVEITCVCVLAALLLHHYGNWKKHHVLVTIAAFISWYFAFMIIFVLPLDVSSTCYRQCMRERNPPTALPNNISTPFNQNATTTTLPTSTKGHNDTISFTKSVTIQPLQDICEKPLSFVPPYILPTLWRVVYWTSQVLTWLILPMMQSYATVGDFTVHGKMKAALIENAIYYGSYLLIFGVLLIYLAIRPDVHIDGSQLMVLAITASNTWGLFLLVLLLGYGLVEVPRSCWNNSKRGYMLSQTHFKIAKLSTEKSEAEENLEDVMEDVKKASETIRYNSALRKHVNTILLKCPDSVQESVKKNMRDDYEDYNNPTETPTEKSLIRLHKKVINTMQNYRRTQCQWRMLMAQAFDLEDTANNEISQRKEYVRSYGKYEGYFQRCYNPKVEWYWKCWIRPIILKVLTVVLAIFSIMVVWSECLFFVESPVLSLFAWFIDLARKNYDYVSIEMVSILTIAYLSFCAYYTIFKIRVFNYYYLASHHQTDENSLLFCGMLLCRLTPPLCLNFLGLIHLDSHVTKQYNLEETSYTKIMGHMDVIPFISSGFNIYFPIFIVLLCFATYFRLGSRCLHFLGFQQFIGDDEMTQEFTDEGKELVKREKRRLQRKEEGDARRKMWSERYGDSSTRGSHYRDKDSDSDTTSSRRIASSKYYDRPPVEENDRTGLLGQAEPIDYMGETIESLDDFADGLNNTNISGAYQGHGYKEGMTGSRGATGSGRYSSAGLGRPKGPPKGIFDDI